MKIHIVSILALTLIIKVLFHRDLGITLVVATFIYITGILPWLTWEFVTKKFQKKESNTDRLLRMANDKVLQKKIKLSNTVFLNFPNLPSDQDLENSEIKDLKIKVQAGKNGENNYTIKITNIGRRVFKNIDIDIRNILLWAGSFGVDTTHMPSNIEYCDSVKCGAEEIQPNETFEINITGYGSYEKYDLERIRYAKISFSSPVKNKLHIPYWVEILVDFPNAI